MDHALAESKRCEQAWKAVRLDAIAASSNFDTTQKKFETARTNLRAASKDQKIADKGKEDHDKVAEAQRVSIHHRGPT